MAGKVEAYHLALGEFISEFAWTEFLIAELLRKEARLPRQSAKALFSGVRIDGARDFINRLYEARGLTRDPLLVRAFEQIGVVTRTRNDILHYGAYPRGETTEYVVSNWRAAHTERSHRQTIVSAEILDAMTWDLIQISLILMHHVTPMNGVPEDEWRECASRPWRYKPTSPPPPASKRPRRGREQQAPPRSSPQ